MSCNDCQKVANMMHAILDGEASKQEMTDFEMHLDKCMKCQDHYESEKNLFKEIKAKLEQKCCPEAVLNSIKFKIQAFLG
jgi:anti-sigma factor (TIGR02949 family)